MPSNPNHKEKKINRRKTLKPFIILRYKLNPSLPNVQQMVLLAKILILIQEGIIKNYERHDYESVDKNSLS